MEESIRQLISNPRNVSLETVDILLQIGYNIIKHPQDEKYRKIRSGNKIIKEKVINVPGAKKCLFDMGFTETEEGYIFPQNGNLVALNRMIINLQNARLRISASVNQTTLIQNESQMYLELTRNLERMTIFEQVHKQDRARSVLPMETLIEDASKNFPGPPLFSNPEFRDVIIIFLLTWFKTSFFKWVDTLPCEICGGESVGGKAGVPTPEESKYMAQRVEIHTCKKCGHGTRFPRYNDPEKLLESRRGRCGEWANCFYLFLRTLGFEARFITDNQDHVWCEFFSIAQDRYIHVDPCENAFDLPLTYEKGWDKEQMYVFGFSHDDLQDVTWRYSNNHQAVLARRTQVREEWLAKTIHNIRINRWRTLLLTPGRKLVLQRRICKELFELMIEKATLDSEGQGRTSGSLAWRLSRGETGKRFRPYVIKPTEKEAKSKRIHLQYCPSKDEYRRLSDNSTVSGWREMLFECIDIFRKEEHDWKMVYLARVPGYDFGKISWKFDLRDVRGKIKEFNVKLIHKTFSDGEVTWSVKSDEDIQRIRTNVEDTNVNDFSKGRNRVTLTALLSEGQGDNAWQHAQLFRSSMSENIVLFDVETAAMDKEKTKLLIENAILCACRSTLEGDFKVDALVGVTLQSGEVVLINIKEKISENLEIHSPCTSSASTPSNSSYSIPNKRKQGLKRKINVGQEDDSSSDVECSSWNVQACGAPVFPSTDSRNDLENSNNNKAIIKPNVNSQLDLTEDRLIDDLLSGGKEASGQILKKIEKIKKEEPDDIMRDKNKPINNNNNREEWLCSNCHKSFATASLLDIHFKIHTGQKPYICDICLRSFSRKDMLVRHTLTHSDAKPFKCSHCNYGCKRRDHLTKHMNNVHGFKKVK
ncbi:DgyrCDS5077 [Dimorphilus gyrociliatus]|uniref:Peptide-N(4)-(N-acetyl-beta-glucosaminyl)asparagine amidase n=1 Tax=Dimorphilus gyrociliatus TaxID=2664684 RepID=A0A7I8VLE9_9ANNE|nr:DgyrCDS5077 [Dimorphilus gyrociliatus]